MPRTLDSASPATIRGSGAPAALILGAGWSSAAGLPLTHQLFDEIPIAHTKAAHDRFVAVARGYDEWRASNADLSAELFMLAVTRGEARTIIDVNGRSMTPRLLDVVLSWPWVVEFLQARLGGPITGETRRAPARYAPQLHMPTRSRRQREFWQSCLENHRPIVVVTTNYDLLAERTIRHRPMRRPPTPGFIYGGVDNSTSSSRSPFGRDRRGDPSPRGSVPLCKLHGSLNWAIHDQRVAVYADVRPAFRSGGGAAIVPPLPEKDVPQWLAPVWESAWDGLARAERWIVVGYSLPEYDLAIRRLLTRAGAASPLCAIELHDPFANELLSRWAGVAPKAQVIACPGL